MSALEKVGAFLVKMVERPADRAVEGLLLSMSPYDIADYLALSAETVSHTLTDLGQSGAIKLMDMRRVRTVDRGALEQACGAGVAA
jgi:CRP-like cAMP-binding protein